MRLVNVNDAFSAAAKNPASGRMTSRRCRRYSPVGSVSRSLSRSATQSTERFLLVQITPNLPPSRSTRAISGTVTAGSIQRHADEISTPSADPDRSGSASPRPETTCAPGERARSTDAILVSGSTATTSRTSLMRARVNRPVPAARSMATAQPSGSSQRTASVGGLGRSRS